MVLIGNLLFFLLFNSFASASTEVVATVSTDRAAVGEVIRYTISISSDSTLNISDHRLPPLDGLNLVHSFPTREDRSVIVNGQFTFQQTRRFNYDFEVIRAGTIEIPPIEIKVNDVMYSTKSIKIVAEAGQPSQRPSAPPPNSQEEEEEVIDDPFFKDADDLFQQLLRRHNIQRPRGPQPKINPNEAFFIQLEADKSEAYEGEQITASWWLYTRNSIQNIDTLKYPNLKAFFKEDIEVATRLDWRQEVINGIPYRKALLVSYALFPLKAGSALIDSYKARCTVLMDGGMLGFGRSYTFTKASQELKVQVKPLPSSSRPENFSGGVGALRVRMTADQKDVVTNQPFALKIRFEGRGNTKSVDLPPLNLPPHLEVYSQRDESKFNRDGTSFKEFELLLIPRQMGKITIPDLNVSFFDPTKGAYYSATAPAIELNVGQGKGASPGAVNPTYSASSPEKSREPTIVNEWYAFQAPTFLERTIIWISIIALVIALGIWRLFVELQIGNKRRNISLQLRSRLKNVRSIVTGDDWRKVGSELTNTIYFVIGSVTGDSGGASAEVKKIFSELPPSIKNEFEPPLLALLSKCETLSFAPESIVGELKEKPSLNKLIDEAEGLLTRLVKSATAEK